MLFLSSNRKKNLAAEREKSVECLAIAMEFLYMVIDFDGQ
jgi:hypothetical protein